MREGPVLRPFCDLRCVPKAGRPQKSQKGLYSDPFPRKAELGFFHFFEIVTGWLVPSSAGQKIPVQPG